MTTQLPDRHPNLSPEIHDQIVRSTIEGGAKLALLPVGGVLRVRTRNTTYRIERVAEGESDHPFLLSGHPRICPEPVRAGISGSSYGGGMLHRQFIGRGMLMEFHVRRDRSYTTTPIAEVEEIQRPAEAAAGRDARPRTAASGRSDRNGS